MEAEKNRVTQGVHEKDICLEVEKKRLLEMFKLKYLYNFALKIMEICFKYGENNQFTIFGFVRSMF